MSCDDGSEEVRNGVISDHEMWVWVWSDHEMWVWSNLYMEFAIHT